jgi:hypothetical protein
MTGTRTSVCPPLVNDIFLLISRKLFSLQKPPLFVYMAKLICYLGMMLTFSTRACILFALNERPPSPFLRRPGRLR